MKALSFFLLFFVICFFVPFTIIRSYRRKHPTKFQRLHQILYPACCLFFTIYFGSIGVASERTVHSVFLLASTAFFATSLVITLRGQMPEENRFSMKQLMLFSTFFALAMGCRAFVQQLD